MFKKIFFLVMTAAVLVGCSTSRQAEVALQKGEFANAIAVYEEYLLEHPQDVQAREKLVIAYVLNQDYDKALATCQSVTDPSPELQLYAGLAQVYEWDFQTALTNWACVDFPEQPLLAEEKMRMISLIDYVSTNSQPQNEMQLEHIELVNNLDPSLQGAGGNSLTMDQVNGMALEVIRREKNREKTAEVIDSLARSLTATLDDIAQAEKFTGESPGIGGGGGGAGGGGGGGGG